MTDYACYYDANGCYVCPAIPASPGTPAKLVTDQRLGWNAGANSVALLTGDVHVTFSYDVVPVGAIVGFKASRSLASEPSLIAHGFYVYRSNGQSLVEVRELGKRVGAPATYTAGDSLEIRRVGNFVTYLHAGTQVAQTPSKLSGAVLVNACLYAAGDTVP